MLASFVLDPGRRSHAIDTLCLEHLGRALQTYADLAGQGKAQIPFAEVADGRPRRTTAAPTAPTVLALHELFAPRSREMAVEPLLRDIEMPLVEVLVDMEWEGIPIDPRAVRPAERRAGRGPAPAGGARSPAWRASRSTSTRPASSRTVLFEKQQLPGPQEDQDRPVAPTPTCWSSSRRWGTSCPG